MNALMIMEVLAIPTPPPSEYHTNYLGSYFHLPLRLRSQNGPPPQISIPRRT
ncbi:hypothetical protein DM02DRAFT_150219 [Periconia macrospinosa]|uniref:Uncharacterized protein n=1 Tax=Periconia macrospinosa TaxID=97972 RepID=A0A2V1EBT3_9PLEO|nr:hypothetical protein DM02DRAFT_150219 [Periconia macrospinosa]